ncbi:MAG: glycosyl transferase [Chloroflexi bacterium]|nr:glycosyl transferase [Chloroflexota bacterium]
MQRIYTWPTLLVMFMVTWCVTYVLFATQVEVFGLTWDEPAYMRAALSYHDWLYRLWRGEWIVMRPEVLSAYWAYNSEHPPLVKLWYAVVAVPLIPFYGDIVAFRMAAIALSAAVFALMATSVTHQWGMRAGIVSVVVLLSMPRFYFHAHLAALDVPGALAYLVPIVLFWHTRHQRAWWIGIVLGVVWGLALATKVNAAFVLPVLGLWWLWCSRQRYVLGRLVLMGATAPFVFVAVWPWLWVDTVERLRAYLRWLTVDHWQIPQWFLGQIYLPPPWYFGIVIIVMVTPLAMLVLGGLGIRWQRQEDRAFIWLLLFAAVLPIIAVMSSSVVYDNERLLMPFFVVWAMLVTHGVMQVSTWLSLGHPQRQRYLWVVVVTLSVIPSALNARQLWPHLLSYYSESIGGLPGAARLQMDHTYWNESYLTAFRYLDEHAPAQARVWLEPWSLDVPHTYQRARVIRDDVLYGSDTGGSTWGRPVEQFTPVDADYVVVTYRFAGWTPAIQALIRGNNQPVFVIERYDVPILEIYRIP